MAEWVMKKLKDIADFNPRESLAKGVVAKKVAMDKLQPFCRDIPGYELEPFSGGTKFRNGDTIMARITPCLENGKTAKVAVLDDGEVGFGSTEYIVFRAKDGVDEDFIYYLVCSPLVREPAIKSMVGSSGRQRVQTDVVQNLEIMVPDYEEQKRISGILKSLDDKITANTEVNKNLLQQSLYIFETLINSASKDGCIGDYCTLKSGFAFKSKWWQDSGIPVIKIGSINQDYLNLSNCSHVSEDKISLAKDFIVSGGDLLIAMTGATIGKFTMVPKMHKTILVNQRVGKFFLGENPINKIPFIYCTLKQPEIISEIINRGQGSAQPNISASDIMSIPCVIPQTDEINNFNLQTAPMFELIINNQFENLILAKTRDWLLPRLMSGEIDISNISF